MNTEVRNLLFGKSSFFGRFSNPSDILYLSCIPTETYLVDQHVQKL